MSDAPASIDEALARPVPDLYPRPRVYNVAVPVIANVKANTPADAYALLAIELRKAGFEPADYGTLGMAPFVAEPGTEADL